MRGSRNQHTFRGPAESSPPVDRMWLTRYSASGEDLHTSCSTSAPPAPSEMMRGMHSWVPVVAAIGKHTGVPANAGAAQKPARRRPAISVCEIARRTHGRRWRRVLAGMRTNAKHEPARGKSRFGRASALASGGRTRPLAAARHPSQLRAHPSFTRTAGAPYGRHAHAAEARGPRYRRIDFALRLPPTLRTSAFVEALQKGVIVSDRAALDARGRQAAALLRLRGVGRFHRSVEDALNSRVLPFMANTHTETSSTGRQMTHWYERAFKRIAGYLHADANHVVIPVGSARPARSIASSRRWACASRARSKTATRCRG